MRYHKAVNIWNLNEIQLKRLPIGQWVYAGDPANKGRFYGQGRTTVVAWFNYGKRPDWVSYCAKLRDYGRTVRGLA
ncbi:hypothetical protein UFOVP63_45 [uncultured Caudovirales phage]|uniref:Uncharacterized protein n=1 Tax=uncultured Caudovirales phage TaxID=2100421 RepID=A0A6J5KUJ2_9CAUD|nr:hypothetical protein UFOVP63_45 [uncultured Caudovirales phage]